MKKLALMTLGMLLAASVCNADAKIEVQDADAAYLQKYVMDNFHEQYPEYYLESKTPEKVVYYLNKALTDPKKNIVIGKARQEIVFTTAQKGEDVVLGLEQSKTNTYNEGNTETVKDSLEIDDIIFLNQYRSFFNDSYSCGFSVANKPNKEGIAILNVYGNGPMAAAGVTNGSIITAVNGVNVLENIKAFQNGLLPDKFSGAAVTFTIKDKQGTRDVVVTPVVRECKYTHIKQARAKAAQEVKEGKRGIESWLKL